MARLQAVRNQKRLLRSLVGEHLIRWTPDIYLRSGTVSFNNYVEKARIQGQVYCGNEFETEGREWIELVGKKMDREIPELIPIFKDLELQRKGSRFRTSLVHDSLIQNHPGIYKRYGVERFLDLATLAQSWGILRLGGGLGTEWVELTPPTRPMTGGDPKFSQMHSNSIHDNQIQDDNGDESNLNFPKAEPTISGQTESLSSASLKVDFKAKEQSFSNEFHLAIAKLEWVEVSRKKTPIPRKSLGEEGGGGVVGEFDDLKRVLKRLQLKKGKVRFRTSLVHDYLMELDPQLYERKGVKKFIPYAHLARELGIIRVGGSAGLEWVELIEGPKLITIKK